MRNWYRRPPERNGHASLRRIQMRVSLTFAPQLLKERVYCKCARPARARRLCFGSVEMRR